MNEVDGCGQPSRLPAPWVVVARRLEYRRAKRPPAGARVLLDDLAAPPAYFIGRNVAGDADA